MIDNKELAKYLSKRIKENELVNYRKTWCQVPTEEDLEFWIQQFKTREVCGHSEWYERFQYNIWIKDKE